MYKKKILVFVLATFLVFGLLTGCNSNSKENSSNQEISIASAGNGGTWYWIGAGMADVITKYCDGVTATNEQTSGGTEDVRLVDGQKADIGFSMTDQIVFAAEGSDPFKKEYSNLRALFSGHENYNVFLTLPDRGINSLYDLKGSNARISLGPAGTSAAPHAEAVLKAHGIDLDKDVKMLYLSFSEQIEGLKDGTLDVARIGGGIPTASIVELTTTNDVVFLNPDLDVLNELQKDHGYWGMRAIPAGTYKGQDEDYYSPTDKTIAFVDESMPEELVYEITKAIMEHTDELAEVHPAGAEWDLADAIEGIEIPFHPGAIKYYKEKGIWPED